MTRKLTCKSTFVVSLIVFFLMLLAVEPAISKENKTEKSVAKTSTSSLETQNIFPLWGYYIDASPEITSIKINNLSSDFWNSKSNFGYNFSVGYFQTFGPLVKAKLGIGISSYNITLTGSGEIQSPEFEDIDRDTYTELLTLSNGIHKVNPLYLTVPISIEFGNTNISKIGYYVNLGFEYSFLLNENNKTSGSYTTKGNYPQWGVTLENIPELGFYSQRDLESGLSLHKSNYSISGGAGITVPLSGVLIFKLGLTGKMGLKSIGADSSKNNEIAPLTQQAYDFRSTYIHNPLATSSGNITRHLGIEFGFYICKLVK